MSKQSWKGSTLLNPEPPVLVSCGGLDKPNRITLGWTGTICTQPSMVSTSVMTDCPVLEESPVNLECRITQRIPLGSHDLFLAEVVACDVDESLLDEKGKLCLDKANLIVYSHGEYLALGKKLGTFGYSVRKKKPAKHKK